MSIFRPARKYDLLTAEQRQRAWQTAFRDSLDRHPDEEIRWEAARWRELGAHKIANLCDQMLHERRIHDFSIPTETTPQGLTALWHRVPQSAVLDLVRSGGQCLIAAIHLVYWMDLTPEEIAA